MMIRGFLHWVNWEQKDSYRFRVNLDHKYFLKNIKNNKTEIIDFYVNGLFVPFLIMAYAIWRKQKNERTLEEILST